MQIKDLKPKQPVDQVTAKVVDKGEARTFEKFGKHGRVCSAVLKDETGECSLTLWNDEIEKIAPGDTVKITNGWVSEYQGQLQLSPGKFGKMEVLEHDATIINAAQAAMQQAQMTLAAKQEEEKKAAEDDMPELVEDEEDVE